MIHYEAVRYKDAFFLDSYDEPEVESGVCEPESMAAVALVHYPVSEGWTVEFWMEFE